MTQTLYEEPAQIDPLGALLAVDAVSRGPRRRCPVCWQQVHHTVREHIEDHYDTAGILCLGGGEPYRITLAYKPKRRPVGTWQWVAA
jgi:hypothetical protein